MLKVLNSKNEKIISWREFDKNDSFKCPDCLSQVIFVDANFKIKHFRHKVESECESEPETERHIEMKKYMLKALNWSDDCLEVPLGFGKPDLYKDNIAIEVQHSKFSYETFMKRISNYSKNNIYVLWIFDETWFTTDRISIVIKKAHELYYGRIYVYSSAGIYPIHLIPQKSYVEEFQGYGGYWKTLKSKKGRMKGEEIQSFSILKTKNNWKQNDNLIARFYDKAFWKENKDGEN